MKDNSLMNTLAAMAIVNQFVPGSNQKERDDWDYIKKEYDLIELKKSTLSRSERRNIIYKWENERPEVVQ